MRVGHQSPEAAGLHQHRESLYEGQEQLVSRTVFSNAHAAPHDDSQTFR